MYDGAIDTFYTVPFLIRLLNEYEIRYDTEYDECDGYTLAELDILEQGGVAVGHTGWEKASLARVAFPVGAARKRK